MGRGNIYCAWSVNAACCGSNVFTRSTDGGLNFSAPTPIPESPRFGTVTVGPDGEVYIAGYSGTFSDLAVAKSTNARDPFATPVFNQVVFVNMGGSIASSSGPNPGGLLGQLWITADHSNGPSHGNVYVLSSIDPVGSDPLDVHFIRSTDGGLTWSAPVRVNDDPLNNGAWQWFGTMSVAPNGRIDAIWNDTRADPVEEHSELYYSSSADQGLTWSENVPLSPQFNHFLGYPMQYKLGDYYDMISDNFGVSIAYAATFNGEQDVYYLRVGDFDCNNNGVPDQQDIADETSPDCNANDVPDECDRDCNDNGLVDECEVLDSISPDCDGNLVPDECDPDFDGDDFIDACDPDIDEDGVLNEDDHCDFTPAELISQGFIMADGRPIGDIDLSCVIDLPDWNNFMLRWLRYGGPGALQTPYWTDWYDYDEDHDIDLRDFNEFMKAFGQE